MQLDSIIILGVSCSRVTLPRADVIGCDVACVGQIAVFSGVLGYPVNPRFAVGRVLLQFARVFNTSNGERPRTSVFILVGDCVEAFIHWLPVAGSAGAALNLQAEGVAAVSIDFRPRAHRIFVVLPDLGAGQDDGVVLLFLPLVVEGGLGFIRRSLVSVKFHRL